MLALSGVRGNARGHAERRVRARYLGRRPSLGDTSADSATSRDDLGPSADRSGLPGAQAAGQGSTPGGMGPSSPFRLSFVRSVVQLCRKLERLRLGRQHIEHAAG
jgi:hypothetical protein